MRCPEERENRQSGRERIRERSSQKVRERETNQEISGREKDRQRGRDEKTEPIEMQIISIYEIIWGTKLLDQDDTKRYTKIQCLAFG